MIEPPVAARKVDFYIDDEEVPYAVALPQVPRTNPASLDSTNTDLLITHIKSADAVAERHTGPHIAGEPHSHSLVPEPASSSASSVNILPFAYDNGAEPAQTPVEETEASQASEEIPATPQNTPADVSTASSTEPSTSTTPTPMPESAPIPIANSSLGYSSVGNSKVLSGSSYAHSTTSLSYSQVARGTALAESKSGSSSSVQPYTSVVHNHDVNASVAYAKPSTSPVSYTSAF